MTKLKRYAEFQQFNPFCKPDWRWQRVLEICDRPDRPGRCSRRDDKMVRAGRNFLLRYRNEPNARKREELFWDYPGLYYAYQIYEKTQLQEDYYVAAMIEARILARQPDWEIAKIASTVEETVAWYEALFFNVRPRLDNRDWVTRHVLIPAVMNNYGTWKADDRSDVVAMFRSSEIARPFYDGTLKLFAYFGGKYLTDIMISGFEAGKPVQSPEDVGRWFDAHFTNAAKRRSHQAMLTCPIDKYNVMDLFVVNTKLMEMERSEESQEAQRSTIERHIEAMLKSIPWTVGDDGRKKMLGTGHEIYEETAADLRDVELIEVAAGAAPDGLHEKVAPLALPAPRRKSRSILDGKDVFAEEDDPS